MTTSPEKTWWENNGYIFGKEISDGLWVCLAPMLFTWRLMLCTTDTVIGFACYERLQRAVDAYLAWDGTGLPLSGYTRIHNLKAAP